MEIDLLPACEIEQEIERALIAVDIDPQRRLAVALRAVLLEWQLRRHGRPSPSRPCDARGGATGSTLQPFKASTLASWARAASTSSGSGS